MNFQVPTSLNLPQWLAKSLSASLVFLAYIAIPFSFLYRSMLKKTRPVSTLASPFRAAIDLKTAKYKALAFYVQDPASGFVVADTGDSLLWSALAACGGVSVNLTAARAPDGQWFRQPLALPQQAAASTISRDMLLGILWYAWRKRRLDIAEALWDYGVKNHWVMGTGDASRTLMEPGLQGTLALIIEALGGKSHWATLFPQLWNKGQVDYQAHLEVLHIALRGEVQGFVDSSQLAVLTEQYNREIMNPFFDFVLARYTDGRCDNGMQVLLTENYWPADRLPKCSDRAEAWLPQRDMGPDWQPGTGDQTWHGCDYLFCVSFL